MDTFWISLIFFGVFLIYLSNRNIFSFTVVSYLFLLPSVFYAPSAILPLLSLSAFTKGLGALLINKIVRFKPIIELSRFRRSKPSSLCSSKKILNYTIILNLVLCIIIGIIYFKIVGIPLFAENVGQARMTMKDQVAGWFIFIRFIRVFFPILIIIYFMSLVNKNVKQKINLCIFIIIDVIFLLFLGFKGNVMMLLFFPFLLYIGLILEKPPIKIFLSIGLLTFASALLVNSMIINKTDIVTVFFNLWERFTEQGFDGITYVVNTIVPNTGFWDGSTYLMDINSILYKLGIIQGQVYNFSAYVAKELLGGRYTAEQAGVAMEGELYVNFGYVGIIVGGFFAGMIMQFIYIATVRSHKDIVITPFILFIHLMIMISLGGPVISMLIDYSITIMFFFVVLVATYFFLSLPTGKIIIKVPVHKGRN